MQYKSVTLAALTAVASASAAVTTAAPQVASSSVSGYIAGQPFSTLTPSATLDCGVANFTSTFGIAVQSVTDSAIIASVSTAAIASPTESTSAATTTLAPSSSASASTAASASSTSNTCAATATVVPQQQSCSNEGTLKLVLEDGILKDNKDRIGSIVSNRQFQFDGPTPQAGAIYAAGWSITNNGTLALGEQEIFYQCLSGNFYNLYDEKIAEQCSPIYLEVVELVDC